MKPALFPVFILLFCTVCSSPDDIAAKKIIGVKIYEYEGDFGRLFEAWEDIGVNTVFASTSLLSNDKFVDLATQHRITTFAILPIFYAPEELKQDSSLFAITNHGKRAQKEWVQFVCPSDLSYRQNKIKFIRDFVLENNPDVISLDFIRHFAYWEKIYPNLPTDSLPNTCFDERCLSAFQKEINIEFPNSLQTENDVYSWIKENHFDQWVSWKSGLITSMVADIVREVKMIDDDVLVNIHVVPWRQNDYDGALLNVVGQDIAALSSYVDYISPMTYSHMMKRKPDWIHSVVKDMSVLTSTEILPSIQVDIAYLSDTFSTEEFKKCLDASLKSPSSGVVFWNWDALYENKQKLEVVKAYEF